jgi:hypothetical protein
MMSMRLNSRGSWSLIALLVVAAIVIIWAAYYFGQSGTTGPVTVKKDSPLLDTKSTKKTVFGRAMDTGRSVDCRERLNQIRLGIQNYKLMNGDERNPRTLADIGLGVGSDYFQCPVSKKPYTYDPATGQVHCPTHDTF